MIMSWGEDKGVRGIRRGRAYNTAIAQPIITIITNCINNYNNTIKCRLKDCMRKKKKKDSIASSISANRLRNNTIQNERFRNGNISEPRISCSTHLVLSRTIILFYISTLKYTYLLPF